MGAESGVPRVWDIYPGPVWARIKEFDFPSVAKVSQGLTRILKCGVERLPVRLGAVSESPPRSGIGKADVPFTPGLF